MPTGVTTTKCSKSRVRRGARAGGALKVNSPRALLLVVATSAMPPKGSTSVTVTPEAGLLTVALATVPLMVMVSSAAATPASASARIRMGTKRVARIRRSSPLPQRANYWLAGVLLPVTGFVFELFDLGQNIGGLLLHRVAHGGEVGVAQLAGLVLEIQVAQVLEGLLLALVKVGQARLLHAALGWSGLEDPEQHSRGDDHRDKEQEAFGGSVRPARVGWDLHLKQQNCGHR